MPCSKWRASKAPRWRSTAISARAAGRAICPRTRTVFIETLKRVDIALPTFDDEAVLWGDPSPEATVARLQAFGIGEIVVKNGPNSALVAASGGQEFVPVPEVVVPVDTTAAGDGFNAGYLAARLSGAEPAQAASAAHRLAGDVIRHPGALVAACGGRDALRRITFLHIACLPESGQD